MTAPELHGLDLVKAKNLRRYQKELKSLVSLAQNELNTLGDSAEINPDMIACWEPSSSVEAAALEVFRLGQRLRAIGEIEDAI